MKPLTSLARSRIPAISSILAMRGILAMSGMLAFAITAHADAFKADDYLTGDWGGARATLHEAGVDMHFNYVGEFAHNTSGGERRASAYADQFALGGSIDLDKLISWSGAIFRLEITNRNGTQLNQKAGFPTLLEVQEIYGRGSVTRLTEFSLEQDLFGDHLSLKGGRLYPESDFWSFSCKFESLMLCGGVPGYITKGWYDYPISTYGGVVVFKPNAAWRFKIGEYDVNPQALSHDQNLNLITTGESMGRLTLAEVQYRSIVGGSMDGDYRFGGWHDSARFPDVVDEAGLPASLAPGPVRQTGESGFYARGEQQVLKNAAGGGLRVFVNFVQTDKNTDTVQQIISAGLWWDAPFASRPADRIGLAASRAHVSSSLNQSELLYDSVLPIGSPARVGVQSNEYPIELNYNLHVIRGISLMPVIEYIRGANGVSGDNGLVLGGRVTVIF